MKLRGFLILAGCFFFCLGVSRYAAQEADLLIAYEAKGEFEDDIWVTSLDGRINHNLTQNRSRSWHPTWSGDGTQIAYANNRDSTADIWIMDANGLNQQNLTASADTDVSPDWSPVSDEIAFISNRDGGYDIYTINAVTAEVTRLTDDAITKSDPAWSADGTQIAYWQASGSDTQITILDVATGDKTVVVETGQNQFPTWSPDGTQIAYFRTQENRVDVYVVDIASGETRNLSDSPAKDERPDWSPDGTQIAFSSDRDGDYNIFLMRPDGTGVTPVTSEAGNELSPAWQPVAAPIDFAANPALSQSTQTVVIGEIDPSEQEALGLGEMRTYAPLQVGYEDVFRIRLEVEVEGATAVITDEPPATESPTLTPEPTETDIPLRDARDVEVYRFMGAELIGFDIGNFDVLPQPTGYVLQIREDDVNYWEWRLRASSERALRNNDLAIRLYLPEVQSDGVLVQRVITTLDVSVEVVDGEPEAPSPYIEPQETSEEDLQGFSVVYSNDSAFFILFTRVTNIAQMTFANDREEIALPVDFPDFEMFDYEVTESTCLYYDMADARLTLPRACENDETTFNRTLNPSDIFWYDARSRRLRDITIRKDGRVFFCQADSNRCDF